MSHGELESHTCISLAVAASGHAHVHEDWHRALASTLTVLIQIIAFEEEANEEGEKKEEHSYCT